MVSNPDYFLQVKFKGLYFLFILFVAQLSACAYKMGYGDRALPGGYSEVAIPVFQNESKEVGLETDFTRALTDRFHRSQVALIKERDRAPVLVRGVVTSVDVVRGLGASQIPNLPRRAVLATEYRLTVAANVEVIRQSDQKIIWTGQFSGSKVYLAPRIGTPGVNSANALYNHSKRRETLRVLAQEMMTEAHDRMTESF
jgi:hypothetical protein